MTVPASPYKVSYLADGTKASYPYTFRILQVADLVVQRLDASKNATTLVYPTDYTVDGVLSYTGGNVNLTAGNLAAGFTLVIFRSPAAAQLTSLQENGAYSAKAIENALDLNAMQLQAVLDQLSRAPLAPLAEAPTGGTLPIASKRAGTVLGFDVAGNWTTTGLTPSLTASVTVGTIAALKAVGTPLSNIVYAVSGYYASGDGGGGFFFWNSADTTTDNGGTVIQLNAGGVGRWNRVVEGVVNPRWFGAKGDGVNDDTASIQATINCIPLSLGGNDHGWTIYFPPGKYKITSTLTIGYRRITFYAQSVMGTASAATIYQATNNITWIDFTTGNADAIAFHGIEFLGNATGTGIVMALGSTGQPCFDSRITNCWFASFGGTGIYGVNLQGCHITNCAVDSGGSTGINLLVGLDNIISNCRFYGMSSNALILGQGSQNVITANIFDFCGAANDASAAILISFTGTDTRGNYIGSNMFRANQNDIVLIGTGGVYGSNTGVNDTAIVGNFTDRNYRHFLYAIDSHQIRCIANTICVPNGTGGFSAIDLQGTCDAAYISGNSVSSSTLPLYGLNLGANTTNTVIGSNKLRGSSGNYNVTAGATLAYENSITGTWTPSIGGTATYTVQEGYYTKVGKLVFVKGKIVINAIGTGSVTTMSGLPFAADSSTNGSQGSGSVSYFSGLATAVVSLVPIANNNATTVLFNALTAAATSMSPSANVFASGTRIDFSIVYTAVT